MAAKKTVTPAEPVKVEWACPKCGAKANEHGKHGAERCEYDQGGSTCQGFICECDDEGTPGHGESYDSVCPEANCYHCGWGGKFPMPPKKAQAWEKQALKAGWSPPAKRAKELGLA